MDLSNLTIIPPEGMEYYIENGEVRFKRKLSLYDIYNELFSNSKMYYIDEYGSASKRIKCDNPFFIDYSQSENNCVSKKQANKLLAINKLMNVAKYLNGDWKPDWSNIKESKYYIYITAYSSIEVASSCHNNSCVVVFKSKELAQQAVDILGEETIKLALSTDW